MPELQLAPAPSPDVQRRALRTALAAVVPGWRPLAERLVGADDERIDWVGVDVRGRGVVVLLAEDGDDLALVARGLAQRDWVAARLADWVQLAPESGLRPEAGVAVVLVAPAFRPAALAAARALSEPVGVCATLRFVHDGAAVAPLLEVVRAPEARPGSARPSAATPAPFRTGLSDADLDLSPEERAEFEDPRDADAS